MKIIIVFGPPGSGKGTQANLLAKSLNAEHLSTGNILRNEVDKKSELGKKVADILKKGILVSDELIIEIVERYISESRSNYFIFDGFPRTLKQAEMFESILEKKSISDVKVVNLFVENNELKNRLLNRARIENRTDDNEETIANRLEVYEKQTYPLLIYFENAKRKILDIEGVGKIEDVQKTIVNALKKD
jgi:adenylate kinase